MDKTATIATLPKVLPYLPEPPVAGVQAVDISYHRSIQGFVTEASQVGRGAGDALLFSKYAELLMGNASGWAAPVALTTPMMAFAGAVIAHNATQGIFRAQEIGDSKGLREQRCLLAAGVGLATAGPVWGVVRAQQITSAVHEASGVNKASTFTAVGGHLIQLGIAIVVVIYALLAALSALKLKDFAKFRRKLNASKNVDEFLQKRINPTSTSIYKKLGDNPEKKLLAEGKALLKKRLPQEAESLGVTLPENLEGFIEKTYGDVGIRLVACIDRVVKLKAKKEAKISRLLPAEVIKELEGKTKTEKVAIINQAISKGVRDETFTLIAAIAGAIGLTLILLGVSTPIGWAILAGSILLVISSLIFVPYCIKNIKAVFESDKKMTKIDKILTIVSTVVAMISTAIVVWLATIGTFGILPLIVAIVVNGAWLGLNSAALIKNYRLEKMDLPKSASDVEKKVNEKREILRKQVESYEQQTQL
jgi:hypothetical protein